MDNDARIQELEKSIRILRSNISQVGTLYSKMLSRITTVESNIDSIKGDISSLKSKINR